MMTRRSKRGQLLVLTALTISLIILYTQAYIYRLSENDNSAGYSLLGDYILSVKQGTEHVVVASLINVTNGGDPSQLRANLGRWKSILSSDYILGSTSLNYTMEAQAPYSDGIWLSWGDNGTGASSASADFELSIGGRGADLNCSFRYNVTTAISVTGHYVQVGSDPDLKEVTVEMELFKDGKYALAEDLTLLYYSNGSWLNPEILPSFTISDFGNGTYRLSFVDAIPGSSVRVLVSAYDQRGIYVRSEATLNEN